jgi:hypothetical protein
MDFRPSRWASGLMVALLLAALLADLPSAQAVTPFTQTCIITGQVATADNCILSSFPYMAIGILLSFMVIAIVYMLGNVMNFKSMQDWYRAELWEAIKTLVMVGVIISSLVLVSAVADILVGVPQGQYVQPFSGTSGALSTNLASLYNADNTYLAQQLNGSYQSYAAVLGLSTGIGILKSFSLSLWIPIPLIPPDVFGSIQFGSMENLLTSNFLSAGPGESAYSITQNISQLVAIPMLIAFQFQSTFFDNLVELGLGILIPLGIIFRAFPLVRDIGGTLIATGIGLALVYPALLLIINLPVSSYIYAFTYSQTLSSSCPFSSGLVCNMWNAVIGLIAQPGLFTVGGAGAANFAKFPLAIALGSNAANNANVVGALIEGYSVGLATPLTYGIFPSLNLIIDNTLGMVVQMILLGIDIMLGLIIVGAITSLLGGKVRLGFGSKLSLRTG